VRTPEDFAKAVPIRTWTDFEPYIDRMTAGEENVLTAEEVLFYGRSSGTTGRPKNVPVTQSYLDEHRAGRRAWMRQVIAQFPGLVRGRLLTIHSPRVEGRTPSGVPYGSITIPLGLNAQNIAVARGFHDIPMEIFFIPDFEAKYYLILRFALDTAISVVGAINPSTIVLFCTKLTEFAPRLIADLRAGTISDALAVDPVLRGRLRKLVKPNPSMADAVERSFSKHGFVKPVDLWPTLCGLLSWKGGSAPFYLAQLPRWFGGLPIMDYGYAATEGNFTVAMDAASNDGVLIPHGHYVEFIPEGNETPLSMDRLEPGGRYRVIVTASSGLCRYDINDIVECTGNYRKTPRVMFLHKGGNMLSITGEKIAESHVVEAASAAAAGAGVPLAGFTCTVRLAETPYYLIGAEPEAAADETKLLDLLARFDRELGRVNMEYEAKRKSLRLAPPRLVVLARGAFERYRQDQVKNGAPDSHCKPPHLARDEKIFTRLTVLEEIGFDG
jgi:hypothetical protein